MYQGASSCTAATAVCPNREYAVRSSSGPDVLLQPADVPSGEYMPGPQSATHAFAPGPEVVPVPQSCACVKSRRAAPEDPGAAQKVPAAHSSHSPATSRVPVLTVSLQSAR